MEEPTLHPDRAESYTFLEKAWPFLTERQKHHCDEVLVELAGTLPSRTSWKSILWGIEESHSQKDVSWKHSAVELPEGILGEAACC